MNRDAFRFNTTPAVTVLMNCTADLFIDVGDDIATEGEWEELFTLVDSVPGCFQKDPKTKVIHHDDGSEMTIGYARLSLVRAPKSIPRMVRVNGEYWKVIPNRTRETRLQYKYDLEYLPDEPDIIVD